MNGSDSDNRTNLIFANELSVLRLSFILNDTFESGTSSFELIFRECCFIMLAQCCIVIPVQEVISQNNFRLASIFTFSHNGADSWHKFITNRTIAA